MLKSFLTISLLIPSLNFLSAENMQSPNNLTNDYELSCKKPKQGPTGPAGRTGPTGPIGPTGPGGAGTSTSGSIVNISQQQFSQTGGTQQVHFQAQAANFGANFGMNLGLNSLEPTAPTGIYITTFTVMGAFNEFSGETGPRANGAAGFIIFVNGTPIAGSASLTPFNVDPTADLSQFNITGTALFQANAGDVIELINSFFFSPTGDQNVVMTIQSVTLTGFQIQ